MNYFKGMTIAAFVVLLISCGQNADVSEAIEKLSDPIVETRLAGIDMLRGNNSDESIQALIVALEDEDPRVQHMAILYLEEIGLPAFSELAARYHALTQLPILQKELEDPAYINPEFEDWVTLPTDKAILVFFPEVIESLAEDPRAELISYHEGEAGDAPLYIMDIEGSRIAVLHPGVGAPLAALRIESLINAGARRIIAVGGAGVLDGSVKFGDLVVISEAVRDEGASYHYLRPGRRVYPDADLRDALAATLVSNEVPHHIGKSWTTDAFFRETHGLVELRRKQKCLVVEMEASLFFALAEFRGVAFAQMVYGADDLSGDQWDERQWRNVPALRKRMFELALETLAALE